MADDMENIENTTTEDEGQISEDDWAAAMSEQAVAEAAHQAAAQPADIFPSFGGTGTGGGMMNELDMILTFRFRSPSNSGAPKSPSKPPATCARFSC